MRSMPGRVPEGGREGGREGEGRGREGRGGKEKVRLVLFLEGYLSLTLHLRIEATRFALCGTLAFGGSVFLHHMSFLWVGLCGTPQTSFT